MFRRVGARWESTILVCAKCSNRLGGGFGDKGKTPLAKVLKKALGKGRRARAVVVPVKCLGVCPSNAVTVIDTRRPREWMIVRAGTPVAHVVALLNE